MALPALGQVALYNNFSTETKGITIGADHCYFWFHQVAGWDTEVACYRSGKLTQLEVGATGETLEHSMVTPEGTFAWLLIPNANGTISYQLTGRGPSDTIDLLVTGTS